MVIAKFLFGLACLGVIWNVVTSILIYNELKKRGNKVSFFWLRMKAPAYVHRYKEITKAETGKVGALFYHWLISINSALVIGIVTVGLIALH